MNKLILKSFQSPGDIVMLTAAVRDLHREFPGQYQTDVRTSADALWENNPYLVPLDKSDPEVRVIDMHYPLIHQSNERPYHFIHGYVQYLEEQLGVRIPLTEFKGDIHFSDDELRYMPQFESGVLPKHYWVIVGGGKYDFTAKWWNPESYQQVVDHFAGRIRFVQCGSDEHWHPRLTGVTDLIGKTDLREFVKVVYRAEGVLCPVTLAMHLAAAVETPPETQRRRACVVVAGGREPTHWEAYPHHQYISMVGMLSCCAKGGCWKSRCQQVGDGDRKDRRDRCEQPVAIGDDLLIPRCMDMITAEDVIRRIEWYLEEPMQDLKTESKVRQPKPAMVTIPKNPTRKRFQLQCRGSIEDLIQVGVVKKHLAHYYPDAIVDVNPDRKLPNSRAMLGLNGKAQTNGYAVTPTQLVRLSNAPFGQSNSPHWPQTPAVHWLLNELHLSPIEDLLQTDLLIPEESARRIQTEFDGQNGKLVLLEKTSESDSPDDQNHQEVIETLNRDGRAFGELVWTDQNWGLAKCRLFGEQNKTVELSSLGDVVALIAHGDLLVSQEGPALQIAQAVKTPSIALWNSCHPVQMLEPVSTTTHVLTKEAEADSQTWQQNAFRGRYRMASHDSLTQVIEDALTGQRTEPPPTAARQDRLPLRDVPVPEPKKPESKETPITTVQNTIPSKVESNTGYSTTTDQKLYAMRFYHGLGDAANFARLLQIYSRRGYRIGVECTPDKEILFKAAGAVIVDSADKTNDWAYPPHNVHAGHGQHHVGSKSGWNISQPPLPDIGDKAELWHEYCQTRVRPIDLVTDEDRRFVEDWLDSLQKPITLLHTKGNTGQNVKSLPDTLAEQLYRHFLDQCDGTLVLLDWDNRVPKLNTYRCRHLVELSEGCSTDRLIALMEAADLIVGVDSGPLHLASLTDTPRVGVWMPGHYPARYSLPDPQQLNLVLAGHTYQWNRYRRIPWNIVEQEGMEWNPAWLASQCARMLQGDAYLSNQQRGSDVLLQDWVLNRCQANRNDLGQIYTDRNRSFDVLLKATTQRFERPMIVETGTIRSEEDWAGAGFATYLLGKYVMERSGELHSVDRTPRHCQFARTWCQDFGDAVTIHEGDSIAYLNSFNRPIDVLYLDSLDTTEPGHAEHGLKEVQAGLPQLHQQSLILFDDTPWINGSFSGKGAHAVPWLMQNGWDILYSGYQVLLKREGT